MYNSSLRHGFKLSAGVDGVAGGDFSRLHTLFLPLIRPAKIALVIALWPCFWYADGGSDGAGRVVGPAIAVHFCK